MNSEDQGRITDWIKLGVDISGNVAGALLGGIFAGTSGTIIGASITPLITETFAKIGYDVKTMLIGKREEIRIGAAYTFALSQIKDNLEKGKSPRTDSFFNQHQSRRSAAEEILEGILRLAQKEFEELKIKHYGYLIANIYFDEGIDQGYANLLLNIADRISYRQLCLLELFNNTGKYELFRKMTENNDDFLKTINHFNISSRPFDSISSSALKTPLKKRKIDLNIEINELIQLDFIDTESGVKQTFLGESFAHFGLTQFGKKIRDLMLLSKLDQSHVNNLADILRYTETGSSFI
jgi:hypothetical protein